MPDEKQMKKTIPEMFQVPDIDDVISVLLGVAPEGEEIEIYEDEEEN